MSWEALNWVAGREPVKLQSPAKGDPSKANRRAVLFCLANRADPEGHCWPSIGYISKRTDLSRSSVRRALDYLVDVDRIIHRQPRDGESSELWLLLPGSPMFDAHHARLADADPVHGEPPTRFTVNHPAAEPMNQGVAHCEPPPGSHMNHDPLREEEEHQRPRDPHRFEPTEADRVAMHAALAQGRAALSTPPPPPPPRPNGDYEPPRPDPTKLGSRRPAQTEGEA